VSFCGNVVGMPAGFAPAGCLQHLLVHSHRGCHGKQGGQAAAALLPLLGCCHAHQHVALGMVAMGPSLPPALGTDKNTPVDDRTSTKHKTKTIDFDQLLVRHYNEKESKVYPCCSASLSLLQYEREIASRIYQLKHDGKKT